jgi:hypothetical protein
MLVHDPPAQAGTTAHVTSHAWALARRVQLAPAMKNGTWLLALALVGCQGDNTVHDQGEVCITSAATDAPLEVRVTLDECISACVDNEIETCSISREGNVLTLSSTFSYAEADEEEICIAVCNAQEATCSTEALPAGSYTLEHGDDSYTLDVPTTNVPRCL